MQAMEFARTSHATPLHPQFPAVAARSPLEASGRAVKQLILIRHGEGMLRGIDRRVDDYLESQLFTNATRIENDFNERVLESRRLLESEIRTRLKEIYDSASRALERARTMRAAGEHEVKRELERLDALLTRCAFSQTG